MKPMTEAIVELHDALGSAGIPHAFGGALALAWCTKDPRATNDVDINILLGVDQLDPVIAALPGGIEVGDHDREVLIRDGQQRLFWDDTPVDLFFSTTTFHEVVATRIEAHRFLDRDIPFLSCTDLAVFKAFFNRSKDWVDIGEMAARGSIRGDEVIGILVRYLGPQDVRIDRFLELLDAPPESPVDPIFRIE